MQVADRPGLTVSVEEAIGQMTWLTESDHAARDLALTYARQIDAALAGGDSAEATKALYLGPHLLKALEALGGTPPTRKALGIGAEVKGQLSRLRSASPARGAA